MRIRVVVADQSSARFFDTEHLGDRLQFASRIGGDPPPARGGDPKPTHPDLVFGRVHSGSGRGGAVEHQCVGGETRPSKQAVKNFARLIGAELERGRSLAVFDRLVLIAGPTFLGMLRAGLPKSVRMIVVAQVPKNLAHCSDSVVSAHIPPSAFTAVRQSA